MIFRSQSKHELEAHLDVEPAGNWQYRFVSQAMYGYWIAFQGGK